MGGSQVLQRFRGHSRAGRQLGEHVLLQLLGTVHRQTHATLLKPLNMDRSCIVSVVYLAAAAATSQQQQQQCMP
jgi:hypothetical protein